MPLLTIIIPAYNVELYIEECIMSILKQNFNDFEVIIVNDGSEDNTLVLSNRMAAHDSRIKVITQENRGVSEARNKGVACANGKYILFVDSDDYLKSDMLGEIACMILDSDCEIIVYNYEIFDYSTRIITKKGLPLSIFERNSTISGLEYLERILSVKKLYPWYPWCYVIKKSYLINNGFFFKKGIHFEDVDLIFKILLNANSIICNDKVAYHYRFNRQGALTARNSINLKTENDKLMVIKDNIDYVKTLKIDRKLKILLCNNFSYLWFISLSLHTLFDNYDKKEAHKNLLIKYESVSLYTKSFSLCLIRVAVRILGIERASFLCRKLLGE